MFVLFMLPFHIRSVCIWVCVAALTALACFTSRLTAASQRDATAREEQICSSWTVHTVCLSCVFVYLFYTVEEQLSMCWKYTSAAIELQNLWDDNVFHCLLFCTGRWSLYIYWYLNLIMYFLCLTRTNCHWKHDIGLDWTSAWLPVV